MRYFIQVIVFVALYSCVNFVGSCTAKNVIPNAKYLLLHDPGVSPCTSDGTACAYDSITTNTIPGIARSEDARALWGSPDTAYAIRISGRPFYVVSMSSDGSMGPSGVMIYEPGNPRHIAAFREISVVKSTRTGAVGEALWTRDLVVDLFALRYNRNEHTISATPSGSIPNCNFMPYPDSGIEIGECRRPVHELLDETYNLHTFAPKAQLFRTSDAYQCADHRFSDMSPIEVISHHADAKSDVLSFQSKQPNAYLKHADISVSYMNGVVTKTVFRLDVLSHTSEILPEDLINGPTLFPLSLHPRFLARGHAEPKAVNAHSATVFLYRSENGEYVVTERALETARRISGTHLYEIRARVEMTGRSRR